MLAQINAFALAGALLGTGQPPSVNVARAAVTVPAAAVTVAWHVPADETPSLLVIACADPTQCRNATHMLWTRIEIVPSATCQVEENKDRVCRGTIYVQPGYRFFYVATEGNAGVVQTIVSPGRNELPLYYDAKGPSRTQGQR